MNATYTVYLRFPSHTPVIQWEPLTAWLPASQGIFSTWQEACDCAAVMWSTPGFIAAEYRILCTWEDGSTFFADI